MVLITGASSGIGESCARAFAKEGHDLVLLARRVDKLEKLAALIKGETGRNVKCFGVDISRREAVEQFASREAGLLAQISILINNAGLAQGLEPIQSGSFDDWDKMIDTNVKGLLYITRVVVPFFLKNNQGHIINMGSVAGRWTYPKGNIYCATKFAVRALNESLRIDLNGTPIRVTEISPGMVETEFSLVRLGDREKAKAVYAGMEALTPEDIAEIAVWCAARPKRVNIQEVIVYPTDQASPQIVHRRPQ